MRKALLNNLKQKKRSADRPVRGRPISISSGIASLVEGLQVARKQKNELSLVSVSTRARRVLELARLDKVFAIHADVAAALRRGPTARARDAAMAKPAKILAKSSRASAGARR